MKSKNVAFMAVAIVFGLVAAFVTSKYGAKAEVVEKVALPVVKKVIPIGTQLTDKNIDEFVGIKEYPRDIVPLEAIIDAKELMGKRVARTMQMANTFVKADTTESPDVVLPAGMKEMAIKVSAVQAAAGFVTPGSKVDIIGMVTDKKDQNIKMPARVLINMLITKVDTMDRRMEGASATPEVKSVSLAVTDEDAMKLKLFENTGVSLVLRDKDQKYEDKKTPFDVNIFEWFGISDKMKELSKNEELNALKLEKVLVAKKTLKTSTKITQENFDEYFEFFEVAGKFPAELAQSSSDIMNKYMASQLTAGQIVPKTLLSDKEVTEAPKTVLAPQVPEAAKKYHRMVIQQGLETVEVFYEEDGKGGYKRVDPNANGTTDANKSSDKGGLVPEQPKEAPKPNLEGEKKERVTMR
jgi:Flp pilus assembly protein CpaB